MSRATPQARPRVPRTTPAADTPAVSDPATDTTAAPVDPPPVVAAPPVIEDTTPTPDPVSTTVAPAASIDTPASALDRPPPAPAATPTGHHADRAGRCSRRVRAGRRSVRARRGRPSAAAPRAGLSAAVGTGSTPSLHRPRSAFPRPCRRSVVPDAGSALSSPLAPPRSWAFSRRLSRSRRSSPSRCSGQGRSSRARRAPSVIAPAGPAGTPLDPGDGPASTAVASSSHRADAPSRSQARKPATAGQADAVGGGSGAPCGGLAGGLAGSAACASGSGSSHAFFYALLLMLGGVAVVISERLRSARRVGARRPSSHSSSDLASPSGG